MKEKKEREEHKDLVGVIYSNEIQRVKQKDKEM